MTHEEMTIFLQENSERIKAAAVDAMIDKIRENIRWGLPSEVQDVVNKFMVDEIAPEVSKALAGEKGAILASVAKAAAEIGDGIAKAMTENAMKNIIGYRGGELLKKLVDD